MTQVVKSRLLFLDSDSVVTDGIGTDFRVSIPSGQITAGDGQFLRISLQNFSMLKNFYNINENNNTIAARTNATPLYKPVSIPSQDYATYFDITKALGQALVTYFTANQAAGGTYTLDETTLLPEEGKNSLSTTDRILFIRITCTADHGMDNTATVLQTRDFDTEDTDEIKMDFSDSYEIFGTRRITDSTSNGQSFKLEFPDQRTITVQGYYPMQRFSQEDLYLHSDLAGTNFASHHFNKTSSSNTLRLGSTTLFGKMPIFNETVTYNANQTTEYFFDWYGDNLTDMRIYVRDCNGRKIPDSNETQSTVGNLNFTIVLRIDTIAFGRTGFSNLKGPSDDLLDISSDVRRADITQGAPAWRVRGAKGLNGQFFSKQASAGPTTGIHPGFPSH
jgi:hypothetical protein